MTSLVLYLLKPASRQSGAPILEIPGICQGMLGLSIARRGLWLLHLSRCADGRGIEGMAGDRGEHRTGREGWQPFRPVPSRNWQKLISMHDLIRAPVAGGGFRLAADLPPAASRSGPTRSERSEPRRDPDRRPGRRPRSAGGPALRGHPRGRSPVDAFVSRRKSLARGVESCPTRLPSSNRPCRVRAPLCPSHGATGPSWPVTWAERSCRKLFCHRAFGKAISHGATGPRY